MSTRAATHRRLIAHNDAAASENLIHDDAEARRLGLRGGLVPGVTLWAYLTPLAAAHLGDEWLASGWSSMRFRQPVYDGDEILCTCEPDEAGARLAIDAPSGTSCAVATASLHGAAFDPEFWSFDDYESPETPGDRPPLTRDTAPIEVPLAPRFVFFGSDEAASYASGVADDSARYRKAGPAELPAVPPALIAAQPSRLLRQNFSYGPSVHTGSIIQQLAPALAGGLYRVDAVLRDTTTRNGRDYVTADVLVRDHEGTPVTRIRHSVIFRFAAAT